MDGIVTEVIRLQAMGHKESARFVSALAQKLREQAAQLKAFEREVVML